MAAVAARETEVDYDSPVKVPKAPKLAKAARALKASKNAKSSVKKPDSKASATKSTAKKTSEDKTSDGPSVPLLCCVCTNQPRFSDISHLLTHLNSKGHLHTVNTARVLSGADLSAALTISTYDKWYADNNLEQMLAERLLGKDGKDKGVNRGKRPGQPLVQALKRKRTHAALSKSENDDDALWMPSRPSQNGRAFVHQQPITFYGDSGETPALNSTENSADWVEEDSETVRLKGIVWPGMNIFDAATPDQRKKRNQRKDASVLQHMQLVSKSIARTELVANLALEIERTRDVYDAPSVENTPQAKKPRRRQKRARITSDNGDESPDIAVKLEPQSDVETRRKTSRARKTQDEKEVQVQDKASEVSPSPKSPEADSESISERLEIASHEDNDDDADVNLDAEFDDSMMGNFANQHPFTIPEDVDLFRARPRFSPGGLEPDRFDVRNRIPLQPMNSNSSLASPTPATKQPSYRTFRGKENNRGLQEQNLGNPNFQFGDTNTHVNQGRIPHVNTHSAFNNFQQQLPQDMVYSQNFQNHWVQPVARAQDSRFNPINGNAGQSLYYGSHMYPVAAGAFGGSEIDHSQLALFDGI